MRTPASKRMQKHLLILLPISALAQYLSLLDGIFYVLALVPILLYFIELTTTSTLTDKIKTGLLYSLASGAAECVWIFGTVGNHFALNLPVQVIAYVVFSLVTQAQYPLMAVAMHYADQRIPGGLRRVALISLLYFALDRIVPRYFGESIATLFVVNHTLLNTLSLTKGAGFDFFCILTCALLAGGITKKSILGRIKYVVFTSMMWTGLLLGGELTSTPHDANPALGGFTAEVIQFRPKPNLTHLSATSLAELNFNSLLSLTKKSIEADKPNLVIWPEYSVEFTFGVADSPFAHLLSKIDTFVLEEKISLIFTAREYGGNGKYYHTAFMLQPNPNNPKAVLVQKYRKTLLAYFGEQNPLGLPSPITPGKELKVFEMSYGGKTIKIGPMICSEGFYGNFVARLMKLKPDLIAMPTSEGLGKHKATAVNYLLKAAQLRAVESGVTVLKASNSGPSAVISPSGAILKQIHKGADGFVSHRFL